jgi:SAM-dependent methyltransferase
VLDLGVGTGRELPALLDAGHAVTGLDFSDEMIALCNRRARPIPIVKADFWERLPFDASAFDAVVALHGTLAHPPDHDALGRLAREVRRVLGAGGVFVVEVPALSWLDALDATARSGALSARRSAADRCVHEDRTAGVSIEAVVLAPEQWRATLSERFAVEIEPLGEHEQLVIARLLS